MILFVCRANVGRSVMAEALFNKMHSTENAISAGTKVQDENGNSLEGQKLKDRTMARPVIDVLKEEGIDVSENVRQTLTLSMLEKASKVLVMAEKETLPDFLIASKKTEYWDVEDPKGKSLEFHRHIKDEIKSRIKKLIEESNLS
ncbi:MAG: hypothetical protein A2928_01390 [Candidatus Taylorbacteria bacterium RIFCSPLOWO2_01_FULL_45_15b]|uniref:Phosphotyrosine protein phosphatase I domain-containing protein n=1 Tax=Candidatus Taylorbacteria bacterium RIFCSPLOWO2_01_FULL_45_15b TaxID=1802319 RepID=A0A1G2N7H7_9BACT|nr:MAG: hypothetical protein A2928_01390 [Candidatus Taylorbacteria bacterium RIFCSPLOWO2_01_FULL_45_15b]